MDAREFMARIKAAAKALAGQFRRQKPVPTPRRPILLPLEPIPADPAEHAIQFAEAWFDRLEFHTEGEKGTELGG